MEKGQYCHRWCVGLYFLFLVILVPNSTLGIEKPWTVGNWAVAEIKTITHNHHWTIENYSQLNQKFGEALDSPSFWAPKNRSFEWNLRYFPMGYEVEYRDYIALYLVYVSGPLPSAHVSTLLKILNNSPNYGMITYTKQEIPKGTGRGSRNIMVRDFFFDRKNSAIVNNKVQVFTDFTFYETTKEISGDCNVRGENVLVDQFSDHLEPLLESGLYSDVAIMVRGQRFPAHKVILAAQSSVFAGLFVKEVTDSIVQAIDIDPNVMKEALRYLYTGRVRNLESISKELLQVASAYKIGGLQALCEENICNSLTFDNAVDVLGFAVRYNDNKLKSKAIEFIAAHADELISTDKFKSFQNFHPHVSSEIFKVMERSQ